MSFWHVRMQFYPADPPAYVCCAAAGLWFPGSSTRRLVVTVLQRKTTKKNLFPACIASRACPQPTTFGQQAFLCRFMLLFVVRVIIKLFLFVINNSSSSTSRNRQPASTATTHIYISMQRKHSNPRSIASCSSFSSSSCC